MKLLNKLNIKNLKNIKFRAFTIAEMTVVLLILSIALAASLPVITSKKKSSSGGGKSLWSEARTKRNDIWFGTQNSGQSVMIGTKAAPDNNTNARLYINAPNSRGKGHIGFLVNGQPKGYLRTDESNYTFTTAPQNGMSGEFNTAFGSHSLFNLTSGDSNANFGSQNLDQLTTGSHNIAIGTTNLNSLVNGKFNIAIGTANMNPAVSSGSAPNTFGNIAIGTTILEEATQATDDVVIGHEAAKYLKGGKVVAIGTRALHSETSNENGSGEGSVAVGYEALKSVKNTGQYHTAVGYRALASQMLFTGATAVGAYALETNTANYDTAVGYQALQLNTTGSSNTALGYKALAANTTGSNNTALGRSSLIVNTTGSYNTAVGSLALKLLTTGNYNTSLGYNSLMKLDTGSYNNSLGYYSAENLTTGTHNTILGNYAGAAISTGSQKTCIGYQACRNYVPSEFDGTSSSNQVMIGSGTGEVFLHANKVYVRRNNANATAGLLNVSGEIIAQGDVQANVYTGLDGNPAQSLYVNVVRGQMFEGHPSGITATFKGIFQVVSDKRLKDIKDKTKRGLKEIKELTVYDYVYKSKKDEKRVGLIAQDVKKVIPEAVAKGNDGYLVINQDIIMYTMFNAIKELGDFVEDLTTKLQAFAIRLTLNESRVQGLIQTNQELSKRVDTLEQRVERLEKQLEKLEKLEK